MDYSILTKKLTAEMKKGVKYQNMAKVWKILLIIVFVPFIVGFVISKLVFWFTAFFYKMIKAPADQLHQWLKNEKDTVQHATQAVMYFICLPVVFGFQLALVLSALSFYFQWLGLQILAFIITLGGARWQPILTEATFDEE